MAALKNIKIPAEVHQSVKLAALLRGETMTVFMVRALEREIELYKGRKKP